MHLPAYMTGVFIAFNAKDVVTRCELAAFYAVNIKAFRYQCYRQVSALHIHQPDAGDFATEFELCRVARRVGKQGKFVQTSTR